jgi:alkanesulfonate monooxygenase SsuD/methylene tetrahydromethanopterin reductase-like flavin-dependent oxidoreductase (luciferase family)
VTTLTAGVALPHYDISLDGGRPAMPADVAAAAATAQRLGFTTGWVSDHFFLDTARYGMAPARTQALEAWTTMTVAASATTSLRIGSLVLCEAFRPPGVVAKMAAALDVVSGGRLELGLGAGWFEPEYVDRGIYFPTPGERVGRLEDYARVVAGMLSASPYSYEGVHYSCTDAYCEPPPAQRPRPPIWLGGKQDRMLGVVARVADGWNTVWWNPAVRTTDAEYQERCDVLARACEAIGRDPASVRRSLGLVALAGRDDADVRRRYERLAASLPAGSFPDLPTYAASGLVGTPDQLAHRLGEIAELGVEHVILTPGPMPFRWSDDWAESIAEFVLPQLGTAQ